MKLNYRTTLIAALFAGLATLSAPATSDLSTTADILDAYDGAYGGAGQGIIIATDADSTVEVILYGVNDDPNTLCATFNGMVDTVTLYNNGLFTPVECN